MILFAILIGIYSYLIFALGLLGLLYKGNIILLTILYILLMTGFTLFRHSGLLAPRSLGEVGSRIISWLDSGVASPGTVWNLASLSRMTTAKDLKHHKVEFCLLLIFFIQAVVNLIGALGPELAIDALWYHLTLPKIYLINHKIFHIPGTLFYYSDMPKLTEMFYTAALSFSNEILAKIIHFSFGILSAIALYKISRKFFSLKLSLLATVLFYSNLVVGWESITAYIDLSRTFFEITALWAFINWYETKKRKFFLASAVILGLAISTKLLALGSLFIFSVLILYVCLKNKESIKKIFINIFTYLITALLIPLPWFIFSFLNTGNPVFPFFTSLYKTEFNLGLLNPLTFIKDTWEILVYSADPLIPIYILIFPLTVFYFSKLKKEIFPIILYSVLAYFVWYITPRSGGGRFILPYLPAFSIVAIATMQALSNAKLIKNVTIAAIIISCFISIVYRGVANARFLPVILGTETKGQFLTRKLNFEFGNFYDTDNYFKANIKSNDRVLLYGFHELYYIQFPFIDSSWVKKGDKFTYIAVQKGELPKKYNSWKLIYYNPVTKVKLYSLK